jgi:hypothetical protein
MHLIFYQVMDCKSFTFLYKEFFLKTETRDVSDVINGMRFGEGLPFLIGRRSLDASAARVGGTGFR